MRANKLGPGVLGGGRKKTTKDLKRENPRVLGRSVSQDATSSSKWQPLGTMHTVSNFGASTQHDLTTGEPSLNPNGVSKDQLELIGSPDASSRSDIDQDSAGLEVAYQTRGMRDQASTDQPAGARNPYAVGSCDFNVRSEPSPSNFLHFGSVAIKTFVSELTTVLTRRSSQDRATARRSNSTGCIPYRSPVRPMQVNPTTEPRLTGLVNLGNTCFMNAVLQALASTPKLLEYFLGGHFKCDLNRGNKMGCRGRLAEAFADLLQAMWRSNFKTISPKVLKKVIAGKAPVFLDNQQHDAHEFLSFLLDGLHEDLKRVISKKCAPVSVASQELTDEDSDERKYRGIKTSLGIEKGREGTPRPSRARKEAPDISTYRLTQQQRKRAEGFDGRGTEKKFAPSSFEHSDAQRLWVRNYGLSAGSSFLQCFALVGNVVYRMHSEIPLGSVRL